MPAVLRIECDHEGCGLHVDIDVQAEGMDEVTGNLDSRHDATRAALYIEGEFVLPEGWVAGGRGFGEFILFCREHGCVCPECHGRSLIERRASWSERAARGGSETIPDTCPTCEGKSVVPS